MGCEDCRQKRRGEPGPTPPPININVRRGSVSPLTAYLIGLALGFGLGRVLPPLKDLA